jgi:hypothetical protein
LFVSLRFVSSRIAQGQQDRPCFPFSFEKGGFASSLLLGADALF